MIELRNLHKAFGSQQILTDVNACFERGKVYGIVGENGAGKTTLFRCIAGLEKYEGDVFTDLTPLKNHLGYLVSEQYFLSKITGEEHILLLAEARGKKIDSIRERNIFNLPLQAYISSYSTGMKKKLAIMAVVLQNNDYLILDEPYNGIDLQSSIILTEIIKRLQQRNKTILISSHIFSTLKETCNEIFLLNEGHFTKHVCQENFDKLEEEMKQHVLLQDIDKLLGS